MNQSKQTYFPVFLTLGLLLFNMLTSYLLSGRFFRISACGCPSVSTFWSDSAISFRWCLVSVRPISTSNGSVSWRTLPFYCLYPSSPFYCCSQTASQNRNPNTKNRLFRSTVSEETVLFLLIQKNSRLHSTSTGKGSVLPSGTGETRSSSDDRGLRSA